jgi:hypothetical protein
MQYLRQSTASQEVLIGPFLDDTDGKTAETGLTIANTDIKVWKTGGTTEASKNSGGGTHIAAGRYYTVLDATDTDTIGPLEINVAVSGALPVKLRCCVLDEAVFDALFGTVALATATNITAATGITLAGVTHTNAVIPTVTTTGTATNVTNGVTVTTNNDKTGYSLATAPPTAVENADALLGRNVAGGSSTGRLVKEALYALRNKVVVSGGNSMTVYATDDTNAAWTASVTTTAGNPITTIDPA